MDQHTDNTPAAHPVGSEEGAVHRLLRNGVLNLVGQGAYAVAYVAAVFALARGLGTAGFGEYYTLFALILIVQLLLEQGMPTVLTCRLSQRPARWRETVAEAGGVCVLLTLGCLVVWAVLGAGWAWLRGDAGLLVPFAAAGVACAAILVERFCGGVFHAFESFGCENLCKIVQGVLFAGLVIGLVAAGQATVASVMVALAVSHLVTALVMLACLQRRWRCLACRFRWAVAKDWLAEASLLGLGDIGRGLTWQLDTLLLGAFRPAAVVGIYSVAFRPLGPLNWLPRCLLQAAFPSLARQAEQDRDSLNRSIATSLRLLWMASLPIAVVVCVFAEPLVVLLAGPEFREAALPLQLLIWIVALSFLSYQFRYFFTAVGRLGLYVKLVGAVLALEVVLKLALIPWAGCYGACASSLLGELVFTAAGLALCRRLGIDGIEWGAMLRAALAAAVMAAVLWLMRDAALPLLALGAALATALYFVLCGLLGSLRWNEVKRLGEAFGGLFRPAARGVEV